MKQKNLFFFLQLSLLPFLYFSSFPLAYALSSDNEQPIIIEADSVDIDENTGVSVYQGDVVFAQGTIRITADKVNVHQVERRTKKIFAWGNPATFRQLTEEQKEVKGRAKRFEYFADKDEFIMVGDAVLTQQTDSFSSDRISYDRKNGLVKAGASAKGQQRVRIILDPESAQ